MVFHTKRTGLLIGVFLILLIGGLFVLVFAPQEEVILVTSFKGCVSEGNPIMESYPRQCISKAGLHFIEDIGNELGKQDIIRIFSPRPGEEITSPLVITGEARGTWFFEASFPVILTDWDGKIIAEHYATTEGEWMTEAFVPFTSTIEFKNPSYGKRGMLILKKDNPSDIPEFDNALEVPVLFKDSDESAVPIQSTDDTHIVYTLDVGLLKEPFITHCTLQNGVFNSCGSLCAEGEICAAVCAYTCEFSQ
ncbi:hypothetical protein HQ403_00105 [Candidatus Kaiserbacteria bacterium]|nr:hypothetical protein [Candidatus Kaiserbacteria bacterium]